MTTRNTFILIATATVLFWIFAAICFGAALSWVFDALATGPNCPGHAPDYLGFCSAGAP